MFWDYDFTGLSRLEVIFQTAELTRRLDKTAVLAVYQAARNLLRLERAWGKPGFFGSGQDFAVALDREVDEVLGVVEA